MRRRTPIKAIRAYCLDCCGNNPNEVRLCVTSHCALFHYRFGKRPGKEHRDEAEVLTPVKAIRTKCLDCSCWMPSEVRNCFLPECSPYPYRMGKNPNCRRKTDNEEAVSPLSSRKTPSRLPLFEDIPLGMNYESFRGENVHPGG